MKKSEEVKQHYVDKDWAYQYFKSETGWDVEHIGLNKATLEKAFKELMPGRNITFIGSSSVLIDLETGTVVHESDEVSEMDMSNKRRLFVGMTKIKTKGDFADIKSKYVYINSVEVTNGETYLRYADYNPVKKVVSFTIDEEVYEKFLSLSSRMAINKSKFVENRIKEFIDKNS